MVPKIKEQLLRLAYENEGVKGKFKLAAGVVWKGRLVTIGVNSYKTHPIMCNNYYTEHQIHLHAEAAALVRASRQMLPQTLQSSHLYVVRVSQGPTPHGEPKGPEWLKLEGYREALARPCKGCMSLIKEYGLKEVYWSVD